MLAEFFGVELYDRFWLSVKVNHGKLNASIKVNRDEAVALYVYTNVVPPFYKSINEALRAGEDEHFILKLLDSALAPNCSDTHP